MSKMSRYWPMIEDGDGAMQLNDVTVDVWTRPTIYIWYDALISTNKATDDDVTIPINDAQFWSTMLQTTMVLWIWSMMSRMTMMFQSCSTMLRTMIMLLNLVQRMKTRFKDINTWFKKWRGNQRKSKCKEKKWAQLQLFRTTVSPQTLLRNQGFEYM